MLARLQRDGGVTVLRIDPDKRASKFYRLRLQPDLFGGWNAVREWGPLRPTSCGRLRAQHRPSRQAAMDALLPEISKRLRRGYKLPTR